MFANLLQFLSPRDPGDLDQAFVQSVQVKRPVPRDPRAEKIILL